MIFHEGHGGKDSPSSSAARAFLRLLGQALRSMPGPLDHPDREGSDFAWGLLDDLESRIDDIERNPSSLRQMHLDPDDFVDLRHMHTALVKYWSEDRG